MTEEFGDPHGDLAQVGAIVEEYDDPRTERGACGARALEGERKVQAVRRDEYPRGASEQYGL